MSETQIDNSSTEPGERPEDFRFPEHGQAKLPSELSETGATKEEFNFYQDRFKGMAERHNQRKGLERVVDKLALENDKRTRPKKITPEYVAQEQAERENEDLDRRLNAERKEWDRTL